MDPMFAHNMQRRLLRAGFSGEKDGTAVPLAEMFERVWRAEPGVGWTWDLAREVISGAEADGWVDQPGAAETVPHYRLTAAGWEELGRATPR